MQHEIFGFQFDHHPTDVDTEFDGDYCEWDATLFSKKTFDLPIGNGNRKYQLYINAQSCEDGGTGYEIGLVFLPRSLHKKQREKAMKDFDGLDESELTVEDVYRSIGGVRLHHQFFDKENDVKKEKLDIIASLIEPVTRYAGFALDHGYDRIGTIGWDMVHMYIHNFDPYSIKTLNKRINLGKKRMREHQDKPNKTRKRNAI